MSDGLTDFRAWIREGRHPPWEPIFQPIVPRRVTEYGRLMWAEDLGLPSYNAPAYFWLGRDAEAA